MPKTIYVAEHIVERTERHLRSQGRRGKEGLALWAGRKPNEGPAIVTTAIIGGRARVGGVSLRLSHLLELTDFLGKHRLTLLAQIHTHPDRIEHSYGDEEHAVSFHEGYVSIVVWDLGVSGLDRFRRTYIYEYTKRTKWRRLSEAEAAGRLIIVPSEHRL